MSTSPRPQQKTMGSLQADTSNNDGNDNSSDGSLGPSCVPAPQLSDLHNFSFSIYYLTQQMKKLKL